MTQSQITFRMHPCAIAFLVCFSVGYFLLIGTLIFVPTMLNHQFTKEVTGLFLGDEKVATRYAASTIGSDPDTSDARTPYQRSVTNLPDPNTLRPTYETYTSISGEDGLDEFKIKSPARYHHFVG